MQAYDLFMLIVLGMATIFGAIKGFAWQVASLASILVSYLVAYRFRFDVAEMIQAKPPWNQFLAMLILYVGSSFVIWVGFRLVSGMIDKVRLKEFDRHLGAAFGLAKGLIFCLLITMFAMSLLGPNQQAAICQSRSGYYIATALDRGVGILPKEIHDVVGPYLANLDSKLKNGQNGQLEAADARGLEWPAGGLPNLPSLSEGLVESLPQLPIPSLHRQNLQSQPDQGWPAGTGQNFQRESGFQVGKILPPSGEPPTFPPQDFPPLSSETLPAGGAAFPALPAGSADFRQPTSGGLRPTGNARQALQPGELLPR